MAGESYSNPTLLPRSPPGWRVAAIDDLCEKVTSGGTPLRSNPAFFESGRHNWFKTGELKDSVLFEAEEKITDMALESSSAKLFPKDTVLMAMYGDGNTITSLGLLAKEAATNQACCAMIPDHAVCDSRFLFYALRFHRDDFIRLASGGAQRNLSGKLIRRFAVNAPPLPEQRAIAHILGTLDDKIELNRRMNETLEAMARALFKSWFVDFDPVRAKHALSKIEGAEGRPLTSSGRAFAGLPKPLADLFPNSFEDSEFGEIPRGWCVKRLSDICESIFSGGTPSTSEKSYWGGDIPWLSSGETRTKFIVSTEKTITSLGVENSSTRFTRAGATVIASAGQGNTRGQTSMLMFESFINQSLVALLPDLNKSTDIHLFFDLEHRYEEFRRISDGHSSRGSLTTKLLAGLHLILPRHEIVRAFDTMTRPIVQQIACSLRESQTLAALRDTLLPKLISGEVRVNATERLIEERIL